MKGFGSDNTKDIIMDWTLGNKKEARFLAQGLGRQWYPFRDRDNWKEIHLGKKVLTCKT